MENVDGRARQCCTAWAVAIDYSRMRVRVYMPEQLRSHGVTGWVVMVV